MNERIRELAEQANFTEQDIEDMSPGFKKFAELIVRECVLISRTSTDGFSAGKRMEEHFGVES
jgi:hypothetical protein